ncbi:MAG: aminodeoxychorismate lyase [Xanthomonadales bacterium]|nr:aminodeoxychorismate lyase [Xanthomonadales bacterium]
MTGTPLFLNGEPASGDWWNRALLYGDGLFETMLWVAGESSMWPWHWQRLDRGCARLGLSLPDEAQLYAECQAALTAAEDLDATSARVIRLTLFRDNEGARGYRTGGIKRSHRLLSLHPVPAGQGQSLSLGVSSVRLGWQPLLGGLKHLNRLEQVLASAECEKQAWDEALMLDQGGRLISAVMGNIVFRMDNTWMTPPVDRCGIAGVTRQWLLDDGPLPIQVCTISEHQLDKIQEIWLTNSVMGARRVKQLSGRPLACSDEAEAMSLAVAQQLGHA